MDFKVYMTDVSPLADASSYHTACRALPAAYQSRLSSFERFSDRQLFIGSRLLLRRACRDAGLPDFPKTMTERKKPYFPDYPDFFFNLSHSGNMALCVVADTPVGCDIEALNPAHLRIAGRVMAPAELAAYQVTADEQDRLDYFYRLWTLKESYVKLTGEGISVDFRSLRIEIEPKLRLVGHDGINLFSLPTSPTYRAACCVLGQIQSPLFSEVDIMSLL